jgi:predicted RNA polymerase sigma factor
VPSPDQLPEDYRYTHSIRAELLRRPGRRAEAIEAYRAAHALTTDEAERRFLGRRFLGRRLIELRGEES